MDPGQRAHVVDLVNGAVRPPDADAPRGATTADLDELADRLGRPVPKELSAWLEICRGERIGPGGMYGARPDDPFVDVAERTPLAWAANGWVAVAGDGCGGTYVLTDDGSIGFVDPMRSIDELDAVVAPDLWSFVIGTLERDQVADR